MKSSHLVHQKNKIKLLGVLIPLIFFIILFLGTHPIPASAASQGSVASAVKSCYSLTLLHTGTGNNPLASPIQSQGCPVEKYKAGETITLTAKPANGWEVGSWTGTNDNVSKKLTNTLTMPAKNHRISVNYVLACYALTRTHTGQGIDPAASPLNSSGCTAGEYHQGELVSLTASPAVGWVVLNWNGTDNDASNALTNTVTIPFSDTTINVNYTGSCHPLTLTHSGNGGNPVASPASSFDCASGEYRMGEVITLTASPVSGWGVGSWVGTNNNTSVEVNNALTMPDSAHLVKVNYIDNSSGCFYLTTLRVGSGKNLVASPVKSASCPSDHYYSAGEVVTLTAAPATGYTIRRWYGTDNNKLRTLTNTWTMGAKNHIVMIDYAKILTLSFRSVGAYDGWVLESTETSNKGGSMGVPGATFMVGDDVQNRQYRGILSFNTGVLPDKAVILSATLKVRKASQVGTNPFTTHNGLKVDIRKPQFGTKVGLQLVDFQALASKPAVATFGKLPVNSWYTAKLMKTSFPFVNRLGKTQFRLRFAKDDNNDKGADFVNFFSGNSTTLSYRPLLIVKYYIP